MRKRMEVELVLQPHEGRILRGYLIDIIEKGESKRFPMAGKVLQSIIEKIESQIKEIVNG